MMVQNTGMLSRNFSVVKTVLKSMVLIGTTKLPAKDVRWLHLHSVFSDVVPSPTLKQVSWTALLFNVRIWQMIFDHNLFYNKH